MDIEKSVRSLHHLERKVLPLLLERIGVEAIASQSGLQTVDVLRALKGLAQKEVVVLHETQQPTVVLGERGKAYADRTLPELQLLRTLGLRAEGMLLEELHTMAGVSREELGIGIGVLKKAGVIVVEDMVRRLNGKEFETSLAQLDAFVKKVGREGYIVLDTFAQRCVDSLKGRNLVRVEVTVSVDAELTENGVALSNALSTVDSDFVEVITPALLASGGWKGKQFRAYDVSITAGPLLGGRRHFVSEAIAAIRKIWIELGFQEMQGPLIDSAFWTFDSLFVPQDHPAREMHDTFFLEGKAQLPEKELVARVKAVHEHGGGLGGRGWGSVWSEDRARQRILRTHTTSVSARTLYQLRNATLPAKFFCIGKVFRNEVLDWSHLFEFFQVEGIVIGDVHFRHLLGYLKEFYRRLGFERLRFRPTFYPYTEMSVGIDVYHPVHQRWIGLGGAGMFRPEVVKPLLGKDVQVLAWGPGMDRIIWAYYGMDDIRSVYDNNIQFLRTRKAMVMQ